ncbi:hypothetical protein KSP40_PGU020113 [Platanthera guangdongensis]|uniref:NAC domain-containing protein n=1 Tax=Platanthera guangdongensis TaxID=2320717 RepID=A0ABR2MCJ3_9ASPA
MYRKENFGELQSVLIEKLLTLAYQDRARSLVTDHFVSITLAELVRENERLEEENKKLKEKKLKEASVIPTRDNKWHFLTCQDRKYPNGTCSSKAMEAGYWKSISKNRNIRFHNRVIRTINTLVFHEG